METTILKEEMLVYFSRLNSDEQQSVLEMVKTFLKNRNTEFVPVTLEEYNRELEEADEEMEAGDFITHEEVKKKYIK